MLTLISKISLFLNRYSVYKFQILICFLFLLSSIFSVGYYHPDEQFQVLEFLNYKMSGDTSVLPWEFHARIRSWTLPAFFYFIQTFIPTENHFILATIFRVISSFLFLCSFFFFYRTLKPYFEEKKLKIIMCCSALAWPVIVFSARTSSENYAQIGLLFCLAFLIKSISKNNFLKFDLFNQNLKFNYVCVLAASFFAGFAFEVRFQVIFIICFLFLWIFLNVSQKVLFSLASILPFLLVLGLGAVIDYWGYGQWTIPFYNYFYTNIIQGVAAEFGITPWYGYFYLSLSKFFSPIYILLYASFFYSFFPKRFKTSYFNSLDQKWSNIFIFSVMPFYFVHFFIGHKEGRFLAPAIIITLVPALSIVYNFLSTLLHRKKIIYLPVLITSFSAYFILNTYYLTFSFFKEGSSLIKYYQYLHTYNISNTRIYVTSSLPHPPPRFYDTNNYKSIPNKNNFDGINDIRENLSKNQAFYILYKGDRDQNFLASDQQIKKHQCSLVYSTVIFPNVFYEKYPIPRGIVRNFSNYRLYKCEVGQ